MLHLLLDCGLFVPVEGKGRAVYQLSGRFYSAAWGVWTELMGVGVPLVELQNPVGQKALRKRANAARQPIHSPGDIVFVRRRMFYARAALNAKGLVRFGLRHIRT